MTDYRPKTLREAQKELEAEQTEKEKGLPGIKEKLAKLDKLAEQGARFETNGAK